MRHEHDVSASVVEGFRPLSESPQRMYVAVFEGDSVLQQLDAGHVGVMKIDVEGAELEGRRRPAQDHSARSPDHLL
jgi:hypothetical protein